MTNMHYNQLFIHVPTYLKLTCDLNLMDYGQLLLNLMQAGILPKTMTKTQELEFSLQHLFSAYFISLHPAYNIHVYIKLEYLVPRFPIDK